MNEKIIKSKEVFICTESFGLAANPAIILIMGANASMVWWDSAFCDKLASKDFYVIRFDHRDVGKSTCYPPGEPPYTVMDMANDVLNIMAAYQIEKAHLAGMSLGGMLAQLVAITHPERVSSLTLIASSVWAELPELPPIDSKILEYHASAATLNWEDSTAVVNYLVAGWRLLNGSRHSFDEKRARQLAQTEIERANNLLSMFNHAQLKGGEHLYGQARHIAAPTLIIHGTEDPVLPYAHGQALHQFIPNAKLVTLSGAGHELHYQDWDIIIDEMVKIAV